MAMVTLAARPWPGLPGPSRGPGEWRV